MPGLMEGGLQPARGFSLAPEARLTLQVLADPAAPYLAALACLPKDIETIVSQDEAELRTHAPRADAILYAFHRGNLLESILPLAHRVRWIHSLWTGVEGILAPELRAHPAPLTNGRGVFRWFLADWVAAAMLHFAFDLRRVIAQQEQRIWKPVTGRSLNGQTLGIVGFGEIGRAAAQRAKYFGMKIAALRRRPELSAGDSLVDAVYAPDRVAELMAASDYVLVAAPLTPETKGLIGEAAIAAMRPAAVVMNVGRGLVIDEPALIRALESGRIRGAALDVFAVEPLPADHPFWRMPHVLLSPHTADRVDGFLNPAFECFFENLERFSKGEKLMNVVDKNAGY